jgi:hypothetical protein
VHVHLKYFFPLLIRLPKRGGAILRTRDHGGADIACNRASLLDGVTLTCYNETAVHTALLCLTLVSDACRNP